LLERSPEAWVGGAPREPLDPYPSNSTRLLAANTKIKVTVTTGAKNLAGIPLSNPKSWTFTTGNG
jgi:hypothetical protein